MTTTSLFGADLDPRELARRTGNPAQIAGVDLLAFEDGPERGLRVLQFRTGGGLDFQVLVDRSMDLGRFDYRGVPFAWQSGTGFRHPSLIDPTSDVGAGFQRGFSGLLCTCGFDHVRQPDKGPADHFDLPLKHQMDYPLHGRGALQPSRLDGYGVDWERGLLWAEGTVTQAFVFGEWLAMTRRVEAPIGGRKVTLTDRVVNRGFSRTPHMYLYHINLGWPLLDEGARFRAPIRGALASNLPRESQQTGYLTQSGPAPRFVQQVIDHDAVADADGRMPVALINDKLGLGFALDYDATRFLCLQQWQAFAEGVYGFGIEPATTHWGGRADAEAKGEIIYLGHGESRSYVSHVTVLDGADDIARFDARVAAIHPQSTDEYPVRTAQPTGGPFVASLPRR